MWRNLKQHIPNTLTFASLFVSYLAVQQIWEGDYLTAAWLVFGGGLLDIFDGASARLLHAQSAIGEYLDHFGDLISQCVIPAVLFYVVFFREWGMVGLLISYTLIMGGMYRMSRAIIEHTASDKRYYRGLPTSIAGALPLSYIIFCDDVWGEYRYPYLAAFMLLTMSTLMVTTLAFEGSAIMHPRNALKDPRSISMILTWSFMVIYGRPFMLMVCFVIYLSVGLGRATWQVFNRQARPVPV